MTRFSPQSPPRDANCMGIGDVEHRSADLVPQSVGPWSSFSSASGLCTMLVTGAASYLGLG